MRLFTALVAPVACAGDWIEGRHVREWIKAFEVEQFLAVALGPLCLRPPIIHVEPVGGANPLQHSVENLPVVFVLVESEMNEVIEGASWLRNCLGVDAVYVTTDWVGSAKIIVRGEPQEGIKIADGREPKCV